VKYKVVLTRTAELDLRKAYRYLLQQGIGRPARDWLAGLRKKIQSLGRDPERASLAPETEVVDYVIREIFYGSGNRGTYRIIFEVEGNVVRVLHVRHGSRQVIQLRSRPIVKLSK